MLFIFRVTISKTSNNKFMFLYNFLWLIFIWNWFRAFKQRMKMGRFADQDPEELKRKEEEKKLKDQRDQEMADAMKIGDRYWNIPFHNHSISLFLYFVWSLCVGYVFFVTLWVSALAFSCSVTVLVLTLTFGLCIIIKHFESMTRAFLDGFVCFCNVCWWMSHHCTKELIVLGYKLTLFRIYPILLHESATCTLCARMFIQIVWHYVVCQCTQVFADLPGSIHLPM
mgnify:CR=1 FL=1